MRIVWICTAEGEQPVDTKPQSVLGVPAEVVLDEGRREAIKASGYRGVGRKEIARPGDRQSNIKWVTGFLHETARSFQHSEGSMPLIQVTDLGVNSQQVQQPPPTDPQ